MHSAETMGELEGRVALVTGAASGIGRATALQYAREGAKVVVSDIDDGAGHETLRTIEEAGGEGIYDRTDVSDPAACEALVRRAERTFGKLDVAFNNAGIGGASAATGAYDVGDWNHVIAINLSGVFYCMRYEIPAMLRAGGGVVVNMASILGQVGFPLAPAYVAAKHGVVGLTKTAAIEYAQQNVRVNVVGPAFIRTPLISALESDPEANRQLVARHPIGRLGTSEEVAELVLWLSSERSSFVTGAYFAVDGGYLAQ